MGRIISLVTAALALAACSNPTSPGSDRSADVAKAKTALGAVAKAPTKAQGRLSAN